MSEILMVLSLAMLLLKCMRDAHDNKVVGPPPMHCDLHRYLAEQE